MQLYIKIPFWLRVLNVIIGLVLILFSGYVIINAGLAILTLILVLSLILIISGISRVFNGFFDKHISKKVRIINISFGLVLIGIGGVVILIPDIGVDILIMLLALGLILQGVARITVGGADTYLAGWFRGLLILLGVISILLGGIVILSPSLGVLTLILLLAWGFIISGIGRIATGLSGYALVEN